MYGVVHSNSEFLYLTLSFSLLANWLVIQLVFYFYLWQTQFCEFPGENTPGFRSWVIPLDEYDSPRQLYFRRNWETWHASLCSSSQAESVLCTRCQGKQGQGKQLLSWAGRRPRDFARADRLFTTFMHVT